jgi:hypothetical protein
LLTCDRICLCAFEDAETRRLVMLGGYGCLPLTIFDEGQRCQDRSILEQALDAEARCQPVFMNKRQIANGSSQETLEMLNFMVVSAPASPSFGEDVTVVHNAWTFFVQGHRMRALWHENAFPHVSDGLCAAGWHRVRGFTRPSGEVVTLLHLSRTDPAVIMSGVTFSPPRPRFGFTRGEQHLLEFSLLDYTDQEIAAFLHLTPDAVKKRWRSIHVKVMAKEPDLLASIQSATGRRRTLLGRIRQSLEELRPYSASS